MKRIVTVILVAILIVSSTLLLVACNGGVKSEQDWNDAMDRLKNCESLTINFNREESANARLNKTYDNWTLAYDKTKGALYVTQDYKTLDLFGNVKEQTYKNHYVEVVDVEVKNYIKNGKGILPAEWETTSNSYGSNDEAIEQLRQILLSYLDQFRLSNFNYADFNLKLGKYEKSEVVNNKNTTWKLTFSDGKLSSASYETKHLKNSSDVDYEKINITLSYSAEVTPPSGLSEVN